MGFREYAVNLLASALGVNSPLGKDGAGGLPQGGASQIANDLPAEWLTATYAPGWPIQPIERPEDVLTPREIDYPLSINATLQPRSGFGLMPFAALKEAYESVAEVRMPVATLLREMLIFKPHLVDKDDGEIEGHPFQWLCDTPDRTSSFDVWATRFMKSSQIYDAGAFFYQYDHDNLNAIRYVDGSTLFIMVDEHGQVPHPKQVSADEEVRKRWLQKTIEWAKAGKALPNTTPAFAQVIKGTPFGWYDTDQIWYKPRSRRVDAPYGESAIEQAWAWILICANITAFELAHYREGNMPEGWLNGPEGWTLEKLAVYEKAFNDRMGAGPTERRRTRLVPFGMTWQPTKPPDFPKELYTQAANNISIFFGVPPSEYGFVPGKGLGGSGFEEAMQSTLFRMGLLPNKNYIEGAMNEVLARAGVDDAWFELGFPTDEMSPEKHKQSIKDLFTSGLMTFNGALSQLGQVGIGPEGDVHVIISNGQVVILEHAIKEGGTPQPGVAGVPTGKAPNAPQIQPNNQVPVSTEPERTEPVTPQDNAVAEKMLRERTLSNFTHKTYSLPTITTIVKGNGHIPTHPKTGHQQHFAGKAKIDDSQAKALAAEFGFDTTQVSLEQFKIGVEEEAGEHPTIQDPELIGQLVSDHLSEDPEYYNKSLSKSQDSGGCMVALDIPDDVGRKIQAEVKGLLPEGSEFIPISEMHVTLFYPGKLDEIEFDLSQLTSAVKDFCRTHAPLVGVIGGVAQFQGNDEMKPLVALFDCPDLPQFRQDLIEALHGADIQEVNDDKHGYIPHITIAYLPADKSLEKSIDIPPLPLTFKDITIAWDNKWYTIPLQASKNIQKIDVSGLLAKHCGVCEDDDAYYGAPVAREAQFTFPDDDHQNEVEVVSMMPEGLQARPGLWKPEGGELETLQYRIGGMQYPREEAAYLLDRALNFFLVPVAYVAQVDDEQGAVIHYSLNATPSKAVSDYAPVWQERAGVLDYIMAQTDRHSGNFKTHPDEPDRPILYDNGLGFPTDDIPPFSPFVDNMRGKSVSDETRRFLMVCVLDMAVWDDIGRLVGAVACAKALARAVIISNIGMIPIEIDAITPLPETQA